MVWFWLGDGFGVVGGFWFGCFGWIDFLGVVLLVVVEFVF